MFEEALLRDELSLGDFASSTAGRNAAVRSVTVAPSQPMALALTTAMKRIGVQSADLDEYVLEAALRRIDVIESIRRLPRDSLFGPHRLKALLSTGDLPFVEAVLHQLHELQLPMLPNFTLEELRMDGKAEAEVVAFLRYVTEELRWALDLPSLLFQALRTSKPAVIDFLFARDAALPRATALPGFPGPLQFISAFETAEHTAVFDHLLNNSHYRQHYKPRFDDTSDIFPVFTPESFQYCCAKGLLSPEQVFSQLPAASFPPPVLLAALRRGLVIPPAFLSASALLHDSALLYSKAVDIFLPEDRPSFSAFLKASAFNALSAAVKLGHVRALSPQEIQLALSACTTVSVGCFYQALRWCLLHGYYPAPSVRHLLPDLVPSLPEDLLQVMDCWRLTIVYAHKMGLDRAALIEEVRSKKGKSPSRRARVREYNDKLLGRLLEQVKPFSR